MFKSEMNAGTTALVVACPGGMARQFRVQVRDAQMPSQWRLVESFREGTLARECAQRLLTAGATARVVDARECAQRLLTAGATARVVDCRALPTAL
ncbi:MAG: hypothetical protein WD872_02515 [Pirellulaceae bacterium]